MEAEATQRDIPPVADPGAPGETSGFSAETLAFLRALAANNRREWFADHKPDYEEYVLGPMRRLALALAPAVLAIDPAIATEPRNGVVSRIYRDTRFVKEGPPYRVQQWLAFKRRAKDWPARPAFFVEFDPDHYRYGMGFYAAPAATMAAIREAIEAEPEVLVAAMERAVRAGYAVCGDRYKRPRLPRDRPAAVQEWYARKSIHLERDRPMPGDFLGRGLVEELRAGFNAAAPLYRFLVKVLAG